MLRDGESVVTPEHGTMRPLACPAYGAQEQWGHGRKQR